jgi:asparagine synthase (glutamine-hydrolysing)
MGFLILTHPSGQAAAAFERMIEDLTSRSDWRVGYRVYGLAVLVEGAHPPIVQPIAGPQGVVGVVVGEIFDRAATLAGQARPMDLKGLADLEPVDACRWLVDHAWGAYAAVICSRQGPGPTILSDPSGGLPVFAWVRDAVTLVGSEAPEGEAAPADLAIDWPRLAEILTDRAQACGPPPLRGLTWVEPGCCRHGEGAGVRTVLWSPARVVRGARTVPSEAQFRGGLDATLAALALNAGIILCEVSGGLDSAVVAGSLAAIGRPPVRAVNFYRDQAEGDERAYARDVAGRTGTPLVEVRRGPLTLDVARLMATAGSVRPNFEALDFVYDDLLCQQIAAAHADTLFTGHGGDVVFYQLGAAEIAADLLRGVPCEGSRLARLADIARRTRRSVWSLAWEGLRGRPGQGSPKHLRATRIFGPVRPARPSHPWLQDLAGLTPAKRAQVGGLAISQGVFSRTRRGDLARLAHPLLSQPVVELCLAIPAPLLSSGEGERSLARRVFADRLPESVINRRSKGEVSVFLGQSVAASAGFLRPFLLDGRLAAQGLLDRSALEELLTAEALIWRDAYGEILAATVLEAWVRHWEGRLGTGLAAPAGSAASVGSTARAS